MWADTVSVERGLSVAAVSSFSVTFSSFVSWEYTDIEIRIWKRPWPNLRCLRDVSVEELKSQSDSE